MRKAHAEWLAALFATASLSACGASQPSQQLVDARSAYARAADSGAKSTNPTDLHEARQALQRAEAAHKDDPQSSEEVDLAYVAQRRAQLAMVRSQAARHQAEAEQAESRKEEILRDKAEKAAKSRDEVKAELSEERAARIRAEEQAQAAKDRLAEMAKLKEEKDRVTITLSGAVIFRTAKAELLPEAADKLNDVVDVLKSYPERDIIVNGHTDSRGSAAYNRKLSRRRAQSVKDYLTSQGVEAQRIKAHGLGESQPVASNDNPEGRANNRRVEIVVQENDAS